MRNAALAVLASCVISVGIVALPDLYASSKTQAQPRAVKSDRQQLPAERRGCTQLAWPYSCVIEPKPERTVRIIVIDRIDYTEGR